MTTQGFSRLSVQWWRSHDGPWAGCWAVCIGGHVAPGFLTGLNPGFVRAVIDDFGNLVGVSA